MCITGAVYPEEKLWLVNRLNHNNYRIPCAKDSATASGTKQGTLGANTYSLVLCIPPKLAEAAIPGLVLTPSLNPFVPRAPRATARHGAPETC